MSEAILLWLFGGVFVLIFTALLWIVRLGNKMSKYDASIARIQGDFSDLVKLFEDHEEREDRQFKEIKEDVGAVHASVNAVNSSVVNLAILVGKAVK
jgi:predicted PurR-regulated permease PerM